MHYFQERCQALFRATMSLSLFSSIQPLDSLFVLSGIIKVDLLDWSSLLFEKNTKTSSHNCLLFQQQQKKVFDVTLAIRFILDSFFLLISQVDKPPSCISSLPFVVNAIPYLPYISANLARVLGLAWQEFEGKVRGRESPPDSALPLCQRLQQV